MILKEDQTVQVMADGYAFGDRLLEGVTFLADLTIKKGKPVITNVRVHPDDEDYLSDLNAKKWIKEAKRYIESDIDIVLEDTDYELPESAKKPRMKPRPIQMVNALDFLQGLADAAQKAVEKAGAAVPGKVASASLMAGKKTIATRKAILTRKAKSK
jgi:hypothetical protein